MVSTKSEIGEDLLGLCLEVLEVLAGQLDGLLLGLLVGVGVELDPAGS